MKLYEYEVNGVGHVAQMSDADAKRLKAKAVRQAAPAKTKAAPAPENKGG